VDLDYHLIPGLAFAEREVLKTTRPETLAQARRIEGVTPAGSIRLLAYVRRFPAARIPATEDAAAASSEGFKEE
jgi:tRNA uridine 5-carboxymethylaminomethyl modification enzyme